ncbi:heavy metal reductase [Candidatus Mancarchaeum acidiphilum]|uniref:Mercuric reductase n=1 Tax=Candidatus Mancarchaeum acidiphilum TaxID=1920749 RepID=A0A218NMV9_9ARCH|nr:mercury(II) reductase [Candidatus Mancarchaeum acidiphilum]ASI13793.1 heavy metal reductase [Candidatus Mancarchaeum acidiphilum]
MTTNHNHLGSPHCLQVGGCHDYIIIGQGAAAFSAAIEANSLGARTLMIGKNETEGSLLGGTCVNVGCVPSKRLITVGEFIDDVRKSRYYGVDADAIVDYSKVVAEKDKLVSGMRSKKYKEVLDKLANVDFVDGFGSLGDSHTVIANGKEYHSNHILIATGARAYIPSIKGLESINPLTNEEALSLKDLPRSLIIIGGRAMGLEFAQMFSHFGSKVTVLQRSGTIIPGWEPVLISKLANYLKDDGISVNTNTAINEVGKDGGEEFVKASVNGKEAIFKAERIMFATGRQPNVEKLNLGAIGLKTDEKGFIQINSKMETNVPGIYAAGDVTGEPMLETLAGKEGKIATDNMFTRNTKEIDLNEVPQAIFTMPEAAMVGLTDDQAHGKGIKCSCNSIPFSMIPKASIIGDERGVIKVVIDYATKRILGVSILSRNAADLIAEATLAVKFKLTIDDIIDTVHVFPTLSEAFKLASQNFYQDISNMSCCTA